MKTKAIYAFHILLVVVAAWGLGYSQARGQEGAPPAPQAPLGLETAFTYQGSLKQAGSAVNGNCDFQFGLWDDSSLGTQLGVTQTLTSMVSSGLFSVQLNGGSEFGQEAFNGKPRWLEEAVRCPAGSGSYSSLMRQLVTAAPYALFSQDALTAADFSGSLYGDVTGGQSSTTVTKLQGRGVASTVPASGQFLKYNGTQWFPGGVVDFTGTLSGDVTGGQKSTTVTKLQGRGVASTSPTTGQVLSYNGAQWAPASLTNSALRTFYYPLYQAQSLDLTVVDAGLKGFYGGFTDGRYGYFVPFANNIGYSGKVARVDLQNFAAGGVTWLDLGALSSGLKGFIGGFTDGRYGYFVPFFNSSGYSGAVTRVDLQNFTPGGVSVLELSAVDSSLQGFWGGFTDGRYGYFVPNGNGIKSGKAVRVDLQNFAAGGVTVLDLAAVDSGLKGFAGGFTDGRYGYFVPSHNDSDFSGKVARVDLQNFTTGGVSVLDLEAVDSGLKGFYGGFSDGRYGYFVPYYTGSGYSGKAARVDLQNFAAGGVTVLDLAAVDSGLKGFAGGFTDGRYGYFVPSQNDSDYSGKVARVDLQNFTTGGVTVLDLAAVDSGLKGFYGGFSDGRYGYFVPNSNSSDYSGKVARIPLFFGGGAP